jgi:hypothetical protein
MDEENINENFTSNCEDEEKGGADEDGQKQEEEDKFIENDGSGDGGEEEHQQIQFSQKYSNFKFILHYRENFAGIPELPTGKILRFQLLSPWDDPNFVGIGGIELFTNEGIRPQIDSIWTNAVESSGELSALIIAQNGKHKNNGGGNKWLVITIKPKFNYPINLRLCNYRHRPSSATADSSLEEPIYIGIQFNEPKTTLAMIRIWVIKNVN